MKKIHYFRHQAAFVAIAPGQFCEIVTLLHFEDERYPRLASINFQTSSQMLGTEFYEREENGYTESTYQEYTVARYAAQAATSEFFGEYQQFQSLPAMVDTSLMAGFMAQVRKPGLIVTLATGRVIKNDLPF